MQRSGSETSSEQDISRPAMLTNEASSTCERTTCDLTSSATSSPASVDGRSPSDLPDGPTTDLFGQALVPVSPSLPPARARQPMTNATCGLRGFLSSPSGTLQSSLESRLRRRLDGVGSTLFSLTWKAKATPAGRPYCQLAASALRISDNDLGSWPTTRSSDGDKGVRSLGGAAKERMRRKNGADLPSIAISAWPTPTTVTGGGQAKRAAGETRHGSNLQDFALLASWATPTSRDHKDGAYQTQIQGGSSDSQCPTRPPSDTHRPWDEIEWLECSDGKARPTQPGLCPLAHGVQRRASKLRAYGNAIVPQIAAEFIISAREAIEADIP